MPLPAALLAVDWCNRCCLLVSGETTSQWSSSYATRTGPDDPRSSALLAASQPANASCGAGGSSVSTQMWSAIALHGECKTCNQIIFGSSVQREYIFLRREHRSPRYSEFVVFTILSQRNDACFAATPFAFERLSQLPVGHTFSFGFKLQVLLIL